MNAERLMMAAGVIAFLLTLYWVRSRELKERYALGWLALATALLFFGFFPDLIKQFAKTWHLSYSSAVLFFSLAVIYVYSFFVSVSLSRQHRKTTRLIQEVGILKEQVQNLRSHHESGKQIQDGFAQSQLKGDGSVDEKPLSGSMDE